MAVKKLTTDTFKTEIIDSGKLAVVDFNADWCGPCRMLGPILEELSDEMTDVTFAGVNIDDEEDLAEEYGISSIPCLVLFKNGEEIDRIVGLRPKDAVESWIGDNK